MNRSCRYFTGTHIKPTLEPGPTFLQTRWSNLSIISWHLWSSQGLLLQYHSVLISPKILQPIKQQDPRSVPQKLIKDAETKKDELKKQMEMAFFQKPKAFDKKQRELVKGMHTKQLRVFLPYFCHICAITISWRNVTAHFRNAHMEHLTDSATALCITSSIEERMEEARQDFGECSLQSVMGIGVLMWSPSLLLFFLLLMEEVNPLV